MNFEYEFIIVDYKLQLIIIIIYQFIIYKNLINIHMIYT